jgi:curved DNA-binding protein CbpA
MTLRNLARNLGPEGSSGGSSGTTGEDPDDDFELDGEQSADEADADLASLFADSDAGAGADGAFALSFDDEGAAGADSEGAGVPPSGDAAGLGADGSDLKPEQRMAIDVAADGIEDKTFYEILLLPRTADAAAIKRSYYRLSKEYHPDKYYRKQLGPYKVKLELIFNKVSEAYRVLSDEQARQDYDTLIFGKDGRDAATPTQATATVDFIPDAQRRKMAADAAKGTARANRQAPQKKKGPAPLFMQKFQAELAVRIAKARRHMDAGQKAMQAGQFQDAAGAFQAAATLDPRNEKAKTLFRNAQSEHRNGKAEEFYKQAQEALLAQDQRRAADLLQKSVDCKPTHGKYYHDFGKLVSAHSLQQKVGLELLRKAVELEPRNLGYTVDLAKAYEELGMPSNAARAWERVQHLDSKHSEAAKALKRLK